MINCIFIFHSDKIKPRYPSAIINSTNCRKLIICDYKFLYLQNDYYEFKSWKPPQVFPQRLLRYLILSIF